MLSGGTAWPWRSRHRIETINQQASSESEQSLIIPADEVPRNVTLSRIEIHKYSLTALAFPLDLKHRCEVLSLKNIPIMSKFLKRLYWISLSHTEQGIHDLVTLRSLTKKKGLFFKFSNNHVASKVPVLISSGEYWHTSLYKLEFVGKADLETHNKKTEAIA